MNSSLHDDGRDCLSDVELQIEAAIDRGETPEAIADLQNGINDSLRRAFPPAQAPPELLQRLREAERSSLPPEPAAATTKRLRLPNWAVAAVLLIGIGSWLVSAGQLMNLNNQNSVYARATVAEVYLTTVDNGFQPDWFCEDEKRFAETFAERQGSGVWLRPLPEGTRMAGLAYLSGLAKNATSLLAWSDDQPVLVMVTRADSIEQSQLETSPGVRIYTQELGDLLVIEASPFDKPIVTPALYLRDPPAEPTGRVPGAAS